MAAVIAASTQDDFSRVFGVYLWVAGGLFACFAVVIATLLLRFSSRRPGSASRVVQHRAAEAGAVVVLALVAAILLVRTFTAEGTEDSLAASPAVRVDVIAYQWGWEFDYPGTSVRIAGQSGAVPTLVLPANRTVQVSLRTRDVLHSFWVPALRYKRDAFPGFANRFDVSVPPGLHRGTCALFCGLHHAEMRFDVRGVSTEAWASFLKDGSVQ
jgi:cytochrome c oxidase subunit 2